MVAPQQTILLSRDGNAALTPATAWMNLENLMLGKEAKHKGHIVYDAICMKCPE